MNGFSNGNASFADPHPQDSFSFGAAEWDSMIANYDEEPTMGLPNGHLTKEHTNQPVNQYLSADSPQGYDASSGVSSPGLSDHNMDTLSSTSLEEDRNDFDNLINYDGEANIEGATDCLRKSYRDCYMDVNEWL